MLPNDALGFLAIFSATVREAMERFIRYFPVLTDGESLTMQLEGDAAIFRYNAWGPQRPGRGQLAEIFAAGFLGLPARVSGRPYDVLSLDFTHARRPEVSLEAYAQVLGRVPNFESRVDGWSFPAHVLDRPMPQADPVLAEFFDTYVKRRLCQRRSRSASER